MTFPTVLEPHRARTRERIARQDVVVDDCRYDRVRWCIVILFRTLKSGCRIDYRRFEHRDRVLPHPGMYLIVVWRTLFVCRMGRSCPEMNYQAIFEPPEWKSVWVAVRHKKPPKRALSLGVMVGLVACFGG